MASEPVWPGGDGWRLEYGAVDAGTGGVAAVEVGECDGSSYSDKDWETPPLLMVCRFLHRDYKNVDELI